MNETEFKYVNQQFEHYLDLMMFRYPSLKLMKLRESRYEKIDEWRNEAVKVYRGTEF